MDDLFPPNPLTAGVRQAVQQPGMLPGGPAPSAPDSSGGEASPEEQQQYDKIVAKSLRYMRVKSSEALKCMKPVKGESGADGIGRFVSGLVHNISESAKRSGVELSGDAVFSAGAEVAEQAADFAVATKLVPKPTDPDRFINEVAVAAANHAIVHEKARGNPMQQEAGDMISKQIAGEVDSGIVPKGFLSAGAQNGTMKEAVQMGATVGERPPMVTGDVPVPVR